MHGELADSTGMFHVSLWTKLTVHFHQCRKQELSFEMLIIQSGIKSQRTHQRPGGPSSMAISYLPAEQQNDNCVNPQPDKSSIVSWTRYNYWCSLWFGFCEGYEFSYSFSSFDVLICRNWQLTGKKEQLLIVILLTDACVWANRAHLNILFLKCMVSSAYSKLLVTSVVMVAAKAGEAKM